MCGAILHMWTKIGDDQSKTSTSTLEILTREQWLFHLNMNI